MSGVGDDLAPFLDLIEYVYFVVTVREDLYAEMSGCLAGFVTQCSIYPLNFLVCISKVNHTLGAPPSQLWQRASISWARIR